LPPRDPGAFARRGITFVPDDRGVFSRLTVAENIRLARHVAHADCSMDIYDLFPSLKTLVGQLAGTLSGGQQQQLAIARALSTGPRLLIIDELSQGLQPSVVQNLTNALIAASREKGIALIVVDQNPELAMRICDRVMVMKGGEVAAAGQSTVVGSDPDFLNLLIV
jgi:branched-chain amino acid transport system ATP-binding protein